jgi:hypothetical protein
MKSYSKKLFLIFLPDVFSSFTSFSVLSLSLVFTLVFPDDPLRSIFFLDSSFLTGWGAFSTGFLTFGTSIDGLASTFLAGSTLTSFCAATGVGSTLATTLFV